MASTTSFDVIGETGTVDIDIDELLAEGAEEDIQEYFSFTRINSVVK